MFVLFINDVTALKVYGQAFCEAKVQQCDKRGPKLSFMDDPLWQKRNNKDFNKDEEKLGITKKLMPFFAIILVGVVSVGF